MNKVAGVFFLILLLALPFAGLAKAESSSFGEVVTSGIKDNDAKDGDIIILSASELVISSSAYQNVIVGVVTPKTEFSIKASSDPTAGKSSSSDKAKQIIVSGVVNVSVSGENGQIKKGDWITTSTIKGHGMKANKSGYVLGSALEDFDGKSKDDKKKIKTSVNVHYYDDGTGFTGNIFDVFKLAVIAAYQQPKLAMRFFGGIAIIIIAILVSFVSIGKLARLGIIAIGRNPLASKKIYVGVFLNTLSSIVIIVTGVAVAYFIFQLEL